MRLRINQLLIDLAILGVILAACGASVDQTPTIQPSPTFATSTPTRATSTLTVSPTRVAPTLTITPAGATSTLTITPTLTSTDWFIAMLTTTPTMYPLPTLPPTCGTVKLGSAGTQKIDNRPNILLQGTAILCGQIYFSLVDMPKTITVLEGLIDLDTGKFNAEDADLWFCPGGGSTIFYYFCDINNTLVRKYRFLFENGKVKDPEQPSFEECLGTKPYTGINDDEAKYFCVITTLGNISRVKMEKYDPLKNVMSVKISFVTWKK